MDKVELNEIEKEELREGQSIYEMTQTAGFQVIKKWLEDMAYHSWVDPRETNSKEEWNWRELVAWASANAARELLENIQKAISQSEYLEKKKNGEIEIKNFKI